MVGVFEAFIRVVYGRMIYMSLPGGQRYINITRNATGPKSGQKDCRKF